MKIVKGKTTGKNVSIGIVVSQFNDFITKRLLDACVEELNRFKVPKKNITVVWVPGAFEIPLVALRLAEKKNIDAVICLGSVIRGETYHFGLVAESATYGISHASLQTGKPVVFEVLVTETVNQATKRSQSKGRNKGREAAVTALEMIDVMKQLS